MGRNGPIDKRDNVYYVNSAALLLEPPVLMSWLVLEQARVANLPG